ncbi:hypothetical protein [Streptomyces sp. NPDC058394]|uniref:hypothetical protein n=1 Tax=Streptomyces sp. NPDC058394 TaxID=3346477 RepID=UPI00364DFB3B
MPQPEETDEAIRLLKKYISDYKSEPISSQAFSLANNKAKNYLTEQKRRKTGAWKELSSHEQLEIQVMTANHGGTRLSAARVAAEVERIENPVERVEPEPVSGMWVGLAAPAHYLRPQLMSPYGSPEQEAAAARVAALPVPGQSYDGQPYSGQPYGGQRPTRG